METAKILDFDNNGVCMAVDEGFLYLGCKGAISKYGLDDMNLAAHIAIKDVAKKKAVYNMLNFSIFEDYIFVWDFCDLHIVQKQDLQLLCTIRLGENASSDVCGVLDFNTPRAYVNIRNGRVDVLDIHTREATRYERSSSTIWAHCIVGNYIYCGTSKGELLEIERFTMQVIRRAQLTKNMAIYSVMFHNGRLYTTSEKSFKVVDVETFEIVPIVPEFMQSVEAKKLGIYSDSFQTTEARIIGMHDGAFVVAEWRRISLFDIETLELRERFEFPTGYRFLRYALLDEDRLYGSDEDGIYCCTLGCHFNDFAYNTYVPTST